jgi:2,3-bisphosphoglycerate-independent phosphoglycerate mutase
MTKVLLLFLDGIGLGPDAPDSNPFARARMPVLERLLGGRRLIDSAAPYEGERATLLALDARLGVSGLPQSATGQAVLLTGLNIPARIGQHYGPKPNPAVADFLRSETLFSRLQMGGGSTALLNAYPPRYFQAVDSGRRLYSSIPLAVTSAGLALFDRDDLYAGRAMSADFTGTGWAQMLGFPDAPVYTPHEAGRRLAKLARGYDFAFFEYWSTDYAGHKQDMSWALAQLATFDQVLEGLVDTMDNEAFVLVVSDHGNMEDLTTRRHTLANVPAIFIGSPEARRRFAEGLVDLTGIAPGILRLLGRST